MLPRVKHLKPQSKFYSFYELFSKTTRIYIKELQYVLAFISLLLTYGFIFCFVFLFTKLITRLISKVHWIGDLLDFKIKANM
jgi:MFS-type transporter involved in bile tolerance (Atg22 family)